MNDRALIIDDDQDHCELIQATLLRLGYAADYTTSAEDALEKVASCAHSYSAILTDLAMREMSGLELCKQLLAAAPNVPVIVVTGNCSTEAGIAALQSGAFDYVTKPIDARALGRSIARAVGRSRLLSELARLHSGTNRSVGLLGDSAIMRRTHDMIERIARSDASVLIHGETGSGKELVARTIHERSGRADGPFVAINCAAVPASLLESELFGHVRGAFTDAKSSRDGLFVQASGGTLFLDEIGDMPLDMQAKLLRALQERCVRPVGASAEVPFDARVFAATHRNLEQEVRAGRFRQDLYYRINVVCVPVPSLREREGDILVLADHFLERFCARAQRQKVRLSAPVAERLRAHEWPGNVRELENCMERLAALSRYDVAIVADLPDALRAVDNERYAGPDSRFEGKLDFATVERDHILQAMVHLQGNKSRVAELLGVDTRTLHRKLESYGVRSGHQVAESSPSAT